MTVRILSTFIGIWLSFAMIGGLADGVILGGYSGGAGDGCEQHTGDAKTLCEATQGEVQTNPESENVFSRVVNWIGAGISFVTAWVSMLALNFSFFSGDFAILGWIVRMIIGGPIIAMLIIQRFGRG